MARPPNKDKQIETRENIVIELPDKYFVVDKKNTW